MALCFQTNTYMEPTFRALLGSSTEEWTICSSILHGTPSPFLYPSEFFLMVAGKN